MGFIVSRLAGGHLTMDVAGSPSQSPTLPNRKRAGPGEKSALLPRNKLGRYAITGKIGRGGMGIVYEAEDTRLQRKVAIKLLRHEVSSNADALTRFFREAQATARLNHANVVAVHDIGEADGSHFIVMELMHGGSAQEFLREHDHFHWAEATKIAIAVCRGMLAAHKAGLIHRDIKPANILRSQDGVVKLGDFGLVKPTGIKGTGITALGEVVGTPHYMSPEQSRCSALDERSDIYSLGATYFALLTGRPPFNPPDSMQVLFAHCAYPVPDPRQLVADIPNACIAIIRKAMEKNRADRYASAGDLLADLERVTAAATTSDGQAAGLPRFIWCDAPSRTHASLAEVYPGERSETGRGFRRWLLGASVVAVVALAIVAAFWANTGRPGSTPTPEPETAAVDSDWPTRLVEVEKAISSRDANVMRQTLESLRAAQLRSPEKFTALAESSRELPGLLEKALAFRESITVKGLVLGFDGHVTGVVYSQEDRLLAVGQSHGEAGALVFDGRTGEKLHTVWPRRGNTMVRVQALAFDGRNLAAVTSDNILELANITSGKEWTIDLGPDVKRVLAVAFSPTHSGYLVAGLEPYGEGKGRRYVKSWNLDTGKEPFAFKTEHSAKVTAVGFAAGGRQVMTGSHDQRVVMWNADTGRIWRELRTNMTVRALACSPQGRTLVVAGQDRDKPLLQFWDYAGETLLATQPLPHGPCQCVAFSRKGELVASGSGSQVLIWDAEKQTLLAALSGHGQRVTAIAFSAEGGILVTGSEDQTVRFWDVSRFLPPRIEPK